MSTDTSRLAPIIALVLGLIAAIWMGSTLGEGNIVESIILLIVLFSIVFFAVFGKNASLEARILAVLVCGYLIAGKGFAYLSPAAPLYVGELALSVLAVLYLIRIAFGKARHFGPLPMVLSIFAILIYSFLWLILGGNWQIYGPMTLRDSATAYYSLFFFIAFVGFQDQESARFFLSKVKWALPFAMVYVIVRAFGYDLVGPAMNATLYGKPIYAPHDDILVPAWCATVIWLAFGMRNKLQRNWFRIFLACSLALLVAGTSKSAYAFAFLGVLIFIAFGGLWRFIRYLAIFSVVAGITLFTVVASHPRLSEKVFGKIEEELQSLDPNNFLTGGKDTDQTTEWRVQWWTKIANDVNAQNPVFGFGPGSDISTPFFLSYYGSNRTFYEDDGTIPRYPHCIIFTVLGRYGYLGLACWLVFFLVLSVSIVKAAVALRKRVVPDGFLIVWTFIIAGFLDSLVQSTFENPFAGIPFWTMLGLGCRMLEQLAIKKKVAPASVSPLPAGGLQPSTSS